MKILIVSSEIVVNKYSASVCTAKIVESLSSEHEVDLLTEPMSIFNFNHNLRKIFLTNYNVKAEKKLLIIKKILHKYFNFNYRYYIRKKSFEHSLNKLTANKYDVIMAFGGGGFFESLNAVIAFKSKVKKLGYIHDPYPGDTYPEPYQTKTNRFTIKEKVKLQNIFNQLDWIAFPSLYLAQWMQNFYTYPDNKIKIIPHLLPKFSNNFKKQSNIVHGLLKKHKITENQYYLHTGTLLKHRPIHSIIKAFEELKATGQINNNFKLVFIGKVNYKIPAYNNNSTVIINERLKLNIVNEIAESATALMIIEHIGNFSPFLPGKVPEYIALKKPIMHFGPNKSETVRIVSQFDKQDYFTAELDKIDEIKKVLYNGGIKIHENKEIIEYFNTRTIINSIM